LLLVITDSGFSINFNKDGVSQSLDNVVDAASAANNLHEIINIRNNNEDVNRKTRNTSKSDDFSDTRTFCQTFLINKNGKPYYPRGFGGHADHYAGFTKKYKINSRMKTLFF